MAEIADVAVIFDDYDVFFEPAGGANGSLYIGLLKNSKSSSHALCFAEHLRRQNLWSDRDVKAVAKEQIPAYVSQLALLEVYGATWLQHECLLLRCDHPKFPSDAQRWAEWKNQFAIVD